MLQLLILLSKTTFQNALIVDFSGGHGIVLIEGVFNSERFTERSVKSDIF